eukprot:g18513.t3
MAYFHAGKPPNSDSLCRYTGRRASGAGGAAPATAAAAFTDSEPPRRDSGIMGNQCEVFSIKRHDATTSRWCEERHAERFGGTRFFRKFSCISRSSSSSSSNSGRAGLGRKGPGRTEGGKTSWSSRNSHNSSQPIRQNRTQKSQPNSQPSSRPRSLSISPSNLRSRWRPGRRSSVPTLQQEPPDVPAAPVAASPPALVAAPTATIEGSTGPYGSSVGHGADAPADTAAWMDISDSGGQGTITSSTLGRGADGTGLGMGASVGGGYAAGEGSSHAPVMVNACAGAGVGTSGRTIPSNGVADAMSLTALLG